MTQRPEPGEGFDLHTVVVLHGLEEPLDVDSGGWASARRVGLSPSCGPQPVVWASAHRVGQPRWAPGLFTPPSDGCQANGLVVEP